jgi:hypothetical protein
MLIHYHNLIDAAMALKSEDEKNPEYDRALFELIRDVAPYDGDTVYMDMEFSENYCQVWAVGEYDLGYRQRRSQRWWVAVLDKVLDHPLVHALPSQFVDELRKVRVDIAGGPF